MKVLSIENYLVVQKSTVVNQFAKYVIDIAYLVRR